MDQVFHHHSVMVVRILFVAHFSLGCTTGVPISAMDADERQGLLFGKMHLVWNETEHSEGFKQCGDCRSCRYNAPRRLWPKYFIPHRTDGHGDPGRATAAAFAGVAVGTEPPKNHYGLYPEARGRNAVCASHPAGSWIALNDN